MRGCSVLLSLLAGLLPCPAHAEASSRDQIIVGTTLAVLGTGSHALVWGLYPERQRPLAVHLIPLAGPIVGIREVRQTPCTDPQHGCPEQAALVVADTVHLGLQVGGLVALGVGLLRDTPPQAVHVQVQPQQVALTLRW